MITEQDLSIDLGRPIRSPIRLLDVGEIGVRREGLLSELQPYFEHLTDDTYLGRQRQLDFLATALPDAAEALSVHHAGYYSGQIGVGGLETYIDRLDEEQRVTFTTLGRISRQRSIARFSVSSRAGELRLLSDGVGRLSPKPDPSKVTWQLDRLREATPFAQAVDDYRAVRRVFAEAAEESVSGPYFRQLLQALADTVHALHPDTDHFRMTVHFMRTLAHADVPGENSPEGIHEDGADYIVSALVLQRRDIEGAESQVYERLPDGQRDLLLSHTLQAGELLFQADTGEEKTFGNDLWHHVTPAYAARRGVVGVRDILGVDIELRG